MIEDHLKEAEGYQAWRGGGAWGAEVQRVSGVRGGGAWGAEVQRGEEGGECECVRGVRCVQRVEGPGAAMAWHGMAWPLSYLIDAIRGGQDHIDDDHEAHRLRGTSRERVRRTIFASRY